MIYVALGGKAVLQRELFGEPSYDRGDGDSLRAALRKLQDEERLDTATLPSLPALKELDEDLAQALHTHAERTKSASADNAGSWVQLARTWGLRPARGPPRPAAQRTMPQDELQRLVEAFLESEGDEDQERRVLNNKRVKHWSREQGNDLYYQVGRQGLSKVRMAARGDVR